MRKQYFVNLVWLYQFDEIVTKHFKLHVYNIFQQYSELKFLKRNIKDNDVTFSVDFSRNYDKKKFHEIQSSYFGHEAFTLFTAARYVKGSNSNCNFKSNIDKDTGLTVIPVVIVSNQTVHERNIAFSCNVLLIKFNKNHFPSVEKVHFWSDGFSSQCRSQYVFRSFSYFPINLELTWNYGEAHHFQRPHDGAGGAIKRKIFPDVTAQKVVIQNSSHFCSYASNVSHVNMIYLDKSEVQIPDVNDSSYVPGTLKVHQVKRVDENTVEFYCNSQYKKSSEMLSNITYIGNVNIDSANNRAISTISLHKDEPEVQNVVVVKYATKKRALAYLGIVQSVTEEDKCHIEYLKRNGGKTVSLKEGDIDIVDVNNILVVLTNFSVNSRGQYIVDTSFTLDM